MAQKRARGLPFPVQLVCHADPAAALQEMKRVLKPLHASILIRETPQYRT